jgi:hypothetical protein
MRGYAVVRGRGCKLLERLLGGVKLKNKDISVVLVSRYGCDGIARYLRETQLGSACCACPSILPGNTRCRLSEDVIDAECADRIIVGWRTWDRKDPFEACLSNSMI